MNAASIGLLCLWNASAAICATLAARRANVVLTVRTPAAQSIACATVAVQCALLSLGNGSWQAIAAAAACGALGVSAITDLQTGYAFDAVTFPALAGVTIAAASHGALAAALTGALTCGGILAVLYAVTRGNGLGFGDVKVGALIGSACGVHTSLTILCAAFVSGGVYAAFRLLRGASRKDSVPFVPYLAASYGAVVLLSGGIA